MIQWNILQSSQTYPSRVVEQITDYQGLRNIRIERFLRIERFTD